MTVIWALVFWHQGMPEIIVVYLAGEWAFLSTTGMPLHYRTVPRLPGAITQRALRQPMPDDVAARGALSEDMVPPA